MARNPLAGQLGLFDGADVEITPAPARRGVVSGYGGQPDRILPVLDEVIDGRYGVIEATGRPVEVIEDARSCRITADEDILESLITQRLIKPADATACKHGAVWKRVNLLKVTPSGEKLRRRWSHLRSVQRG